MTNNGFIRAEKHVDVILFCQFCEAVPDAHPQRPNQYHMNGIAQGWHLLSPFPSPHVDSAKENLRYTLLPLISTAFVKALAIETCMGKRKENCNLVFIPFLKNILTGIMMRFCSVIMAQYTAIKDLHQGKFTCLQG